jgi:hypothetical protein
MNLEENNNEENDIEESKDLLKVCISNDDDKYLLKIFLSKKNESIIFLLEKEKIKTYYYYGKFDFNKLKQINKIFNSDNNIINAFLRIKDIINRCSCLIEKKSNLIKIFFMRNSQESFLYFKVRKKIVAQNRLNSQIVEEIEDNKAKIKKLKKQLAKLDKTIQNKNNLIDKINNNIIKITNILNNINIKVQNNYNNNDKSQKEFNDKIEMTKKELINSSNFLDAKLLKDEKEKKANKYNINVNKIQRKSETNQKDKKNDEILKNKKIYETLITYNCISIVIIIYLLYLLKNLKSNLNYEGMKENDLMKKILFLKSIDDSFVEIGGIKDNIIDFQLKNNPNDNKEKNSKNRKIKYKMKEKLNEKRGISLLYNHKEKRYFRKHIRKRINARIKDISLELVYNSKEPSKYRDIFENPKDIFEILILMKNKEGKRLGIFSNNILFSNSNSDTSHISEYAGFILNNDYIVETHLQYFFDNYAAYLQNIYEFIINERTNDSKSKSSEILRDIDLFEIYQVNYIR